MDGPGSRLGKSQVTVSAGGDGRGSRQTREDVAEPRRGALVGHGRELALELLAACARVVIGAEAPDPLVVVLTDEQAARRHVGHDACSLAALVADVPETGQDLPPGRSEVRGDDRRAVRRL